MDCVSKQNIYQQSCSKSISLYDLTTSCYWFDFKFFNQLIKETIKPITVFSVFIGTGSWISTNNFIFINCVFSLNTTSSMLLHSSPPRSKEPSMSSRKTSKTSLDNVETISSGGGEYTNSAGGSLSWRQNDTSRLSENCSEEQSSQYCQECDCKLCRVYVFICITFMSITYKKYVFRLFKKQCFHGYGIQKIL